MKIRPLEVELFQAEWQTQKQTDGRTERPKEASIRFSQYCESSCN